MITIMTPKQMAVAQKDVDHIENKAQMIELCMLRSDYIPYQDHPNKDIREIEIPMIYPYEYLPLQDLFGNSGWQLIMRDRHRGNCAVTVAQTKNERKKYIKKLMEDEGHKLAPWKLNVIRTEETHCLNKGCDLKIVFDPEKRAEYPLNEHVWAADVIKCPARARC